MQRPAAPAPPLKPVPKPQADPKPCPEGSALALECASVSFNTVLSAAVGGKSGISRSPCGRRGFSQGRSVVIIVIAASFCLPGAALRTQLSVPPLEMPLTVPASGLCGLSLPDLALLTAWGRKGRGRALSGCGQELPRLKLERPEKGEE